MKKYIGLSIAAILLVEACSTMSQTTKSTLVGAGAGTAAGAAIGALIGNGKGAAIGAAIGGTVGTGAGYAIGKKMQKKADELAKNLDNAEVETITDQNGLEAIKVTFNSGILFPTNGTTLSATSKQELSTFAQNMRDLTDTDITVYGHTDNTGTAAVNERISAQRADAVASYLMQNGISAGRITTRGLSYNMPVADNSTAQGRAQNRRVEIYVSANENMIKSAENGTL